MAEPETQYEYGRTPEQTEGGLLGLFDMISGPLADAFTRERREVITPSKTTYREIDGQAYPTTTPGVYGPVERNLEYMPVVQGARSAYDFAGKFFSDGKFREQTGSALSKGVGQMFSDYIRSASQGGETTYDPVEKREVKLDPLLPLGLGMAASMVAPVKGSGAVLGMFAGRNADTADPKKFARAEAMASKGRSREDIWKETGLFRWERNGEPISGWRFEISDEMSKSVFNPRVQTPTGRLRVKEKPVLSDLLEHPEFYKAFPGKTLEPATDSLKNITLQRAALKAELVALKKRGLGKEELEAETKRLEGLDGDLIRELIYALTPGGPAKADPSVRSGPPFIGTRGMEARMERPVAGIPIRALTKKDDAAATYGPNFDRIGTTDRPGAYNKQFEKIPWDEQGKYAQHFTDYEYKQALGKAVEDFKEAGISLNVSRMGEVDENATYRLRKWDGKGGPEDAINPEGLPDHLKRQWDQLQNFSKIYYKKDYDPALRFRGSMIHEGQHGIQHRTPGFEGGANPAEFTPARIGRVKDPQTGKNLTPKEIYMRILGEAEARLADTRKDLTDKERDERFPWTREGGLDRREDDLLLRKDWESPDRKASGGFVDKPLYNDARIGGMI